ncbi:MAG: S8 family serine peptidase [Planctomycetota bacterium]
MQFRYQLALGVVLACTVLLLVWTPENLRSQDAADSPAGQNASAVSSLEFGAAFDLAAQREFELQLSNEQRTRLVRLRSRLALADPDCSLPVEPQQPFYVKLRADMTRALGDSLSEAGATFIGYYNPHAHLVRADDAAALKRIGKILRADPLVAGTLAQVPEDKLSDDFFELALSPVNHSGEYEVLFWRDVNVEQARSLLSDANGYVLEATTDESGRIDLQTPIVAMALDETGFQRVLHSHLIEQIIPRVLKQPDNQTSAVMSSADPAVIDVAPYNLDGTGQIVGVWDEGPARDTHDNLQNAPAGSPINNGAKRVLQIDTTLGNGGGVGLSNHGTHVTGTIIGDGSGDTQTHSVTGNPESQGYAHKAFCVSHNWDNVFSERRQSKHDWNHVADNHSWSNGSSFGGYNGYTQQFDFDNRDSWLCQVMSAGNYATRSSRPFSDSGMTVYASNAHRNGMIIANVQDNENINGSSSRGPAADGRLIPQFAANGSGLRSCIASGDSAYASYTGTSMSGPSVCGSVVLLSQLWQREHNERMLAPDVIRAVLALTARDKFNTGPDYRYGFGIVDCKAAADLILADKQNGKQIVRGAARSGDVVEYSVNVTSSTEPLRVVLSWLDVYGNTNANPVLVNDLDVELIAPGGSTTYFPYGGVTTAADGDEDHVFTTTGPNARDNIELVNVDSPAIGTWTLRVKGTSIPANPQTGFANDVQGFVLTSNREIGAQQLKFEDNLNTGTPVSIPDNNTSGITRTFTVNDARVITGVRVITRIMHERRGDLVIELEHPGGTTVTLKSKNSGPEDDYTDVIGIFPDTRQPDDDVMALMCLPVQGVWKVHVSDRAGGNTGTLDYLALELDVRTNAAPVADAGADFDVREGNSGQLNASQTADADGDPITYAWVQTSGSVTLNLSSATAIQPSFSAPSVSQDETVTFELTATDCSGASTTDSVVVTIKNNLAPVADAGSDITLIEGDGGQLDASGSTDPEGDNISYQWVQTAGAITIVLSSATAQLPTFTTPTPIAQNESVTFELTATDTRGDFSTDTVSVTIELNLAPTSNAGPSFAEIWGASVQLDGTASSDPNTGDVLAYSWVQTGGTNTVTLSSSSDSQPTFTAPAVDDTLTFELTVTDLRGLSSTSSVTVWINETGSVPVSGSGKKGGGGCSTDSGTSWLYLLLLLALGGTLWYRSRSA